MQDIHLLYTQELVLQFALLNVTWNSSCFNVCLRIYLCSFYHFFIKIPFWINWNMDQINWNAVPIIKFLDYKF